MRSRVELLLRVIGVAAVLAWIALALAPTAATSGAFVSVADLGRELPRLTRDGAAAVHVRIDSLPGASASAWLAAMRRSGARVTWGGDLAPLAVEAFRSAAPAGDVVVLAAAAPGAAVLEDALGVLDTLDGGGALRLASVEGTLSLATGSQVARVAPAPRESQAPKAIHVSGPASWEAKFVIAALEEAGWIVDARLFVAPGRDIVQGRARPLDTATYAAVIVLDSVAAETARGIEAFARAGGGVVLAGDANNASRVRPLLAWRAAEREAAPLGVMPGDTAWRGLSRIPLVLASGPEALAVEGSARRAMVAARRHFAGRVAAVGYDETWRWRMAGGPNSVAEHRDWWSELVAGVALRPESGASGAAPVAALHAALGLPADAMRAPPAFPRNALANLLGALALAALLAEWLLRRSRGAR